MIKTWEEINEYCRIMKLNGIAESYKSALEGAKDYEEYLLRLLVHESEVSEKRSAEHRINSARFPCRKYLENLELDCLPKGMCRRLPELMTLDFIKNGQNLFLTCNPGTGKKHTAIGLGIKACEAGYHVLFTTIPYLVTELKESSNAKKLNTYERRFEKYNLVIADELGYISFDREGADFLFSNLSLRADTKSTIITSNLTFER